MSSVRLRRLKSDYEAVRRLVRMHPRIGIDGVVGNPPERYRLVMKVTSLRERGEAIELAHEHRLEVTLPGGYPRDAPLCRMLTPVFHPNIAPHAVCIGDHWTAAESLDVMIQRVGEMLAYQSYNIKSPLNGRAAQWVEEHIGELPVDRGELFVDLSQEPAPAADNVVACANCGARDPSVRCDAGHPLCADCVVHCPAGLHILCLACGAKKCARCAPTTLCANCGGDAATGAPCAAGHPTCGDCMVWCTSCGKQLCFTCGSYPCRACAPA